MKPTERLRFYMQNYLKYDLKFFTLFLILYMFATTFNYAQISECMECHGDANLTMPRNGKIISLYVNLYEYKNSVHGKLDCNECHTNFDPQDIPHKPGKDIYKVNCASCHEDQVVQSENDIHHRLVDVVKDLPTCVTCHGIHNTKSVQDITDKSQEYCSDCHETNMLLVYPYHLKEKEAETNCSNCHDSDILHSDLDYSVHKDLFCTDCHICPEDNKAFFKQAISNNPDLTATNCIPCHTQEFKEHKTSIHGLLIQKGDTDAAACWDCHGGHDILAINDRESPVYITNITKTCGSCHADTTFLAEHPLPIVDPVKTYAQSVHGKLYEEGAVNVPTCITCHGIHDIKNVVQPGSRISPFNLPNACEDCHPKETKEYKESIHWAYALKGFRFSPVCNDCHNEHGIQAITGPQSRQEARKIQEETCMNCHQSKMLANKVGLHADEPHTYHDSYHGLAVMRGDEDAAMCVDCHEVHRILPKNNPESSVNVNNVKMTCQKCHEDATQTFAESYSHHDITVESKFVEGLIKNIYFWLIVAVIGGMVLHNLIIYIYEVRRKKKHIKSSPTIPRFTKNEVVQHILLLTSFITLAITGFALKYPNSWWSEGLAALGLTETLRQYVHRTSAVIMGTTGFYHILYLIFTKRGRTVLAALLPKFKDLSQAVQNIAYYLHLTKSKPEFDEYDYTEKAEYWALIWGTLIMGATGFILWFPTSVGEWAPIWLIKVSETIHFYEAILASLAILVWHWFFVIFHPKEYPMSLTWTDGQMTVHDYKHHHPEHFKFVLKEWIDYKTNAKEYKNLDIDTQLFIENLKKRGYDPDKVFLDELKTDINLRKWLDETFEGVNLEKIMS